MNFIGKVLVRLSGLRRANATDVRAKLDKPPVIVRLGSVAGILAKQQMTLVT